MVTPRKINKQEKVDFAWYLAEEHLGGFEANDNLERAGQLIENAAIAVFDNYIAGSKLVVVVWNSSPDQYEVFTWQDEKISRVNQDPEFQSVEE